MKVLKTKNRGITLIALVITIIVLLILAGISLSLVAGSDGILSKAGKSVEKNKTASAKEIAELVIMDVQADYYDKTYVDDNYTMSKTDYIMEALKEGKISGSYLVKAEDRKIKVYQGEGDTLTEVASGILTEEGRMEWDDQVGGTIPKPDPNPEESSEGWMQDKVSVTNGEVMLTVGSKVSGYTANGVSDWYVLGAKDGKLLITTNQNVTTVTLEEQEGYVNGIAKLNTVAEAYTNANYAEEKARTIDVDDINRVTGYDPDVANYDNGSTPTSKWKNEMTYRNNGGKIYYKGSKYPIIEEASSHTFFTYWTGSEWKSLASGESTTITYTYYEYYPQTLTNISGSGTQIKDVANSEVAYNLLFANTSGSDYYWLGSQYAGTFAGSVYYGMRDVDEGYVNGGYLYCSSGAASSASLGVRPVVSLKSGIKVGNDGSLSL